MRELVVVEVVGTEPEAELLCSRKLTNRGAGAGDGLSTAGAHEILVNPEDEQSARELLHGPG